MDRINYKYTSIIPYNRRPLSNVHNFSPFDLTIILLKLRFERAGRSNLNACCHQVLANLLAGAGNGIR